MRTLLAILLALLLALGSAAPAALAGEDDDEDDKSGSGKDGKDHDEKDDDEDERSGKDESPEDCDEDEVFDAAKRECEDADEAEASDDDENETEVCDEDEVWVAAKEECEDVEDLETPESCAADEVWVEAEAECDEREECDADESYNATRNECDELPKHLRPCDDDEVRDPATGKCREIEDDADDCDEDESFNETSLRCERFEHGRKGRCVSTEYEYEREEEFANGTELKEKVRERTVDCPGTEHDRFERKVKTHWKTAEPGDDGTDVRIERSEKVKIEVKVKGDRDENLNLTLDENASRLRVVDPAGVGPAMEVAFLEAVEFDDLNGDGAFDLDDRLLHAWVIEDLPVDAEDDNGTLTVVYDLPVGGTLAFVYREDGGRAKFDVRLDHVNWTTATSQLALRASFKAENAAYHRIGGNPALVTEKDGRLAYFDWMENVTVDGEDGDVRATVYVGDGAAAGTAQLYLSYPRGDVVVHDPSVGYMAIQSVAVVKEVLLHPAAYAVAAAAAGVFLAAGYIVRRRS